MGKITKHINELDKKKHAVFTNGQIIIKTNIRNLITQIMLSEFYSFFFLFFILFISTVKHKINLCPWVDWNP